MNNFPSQKNNSNKSFQTIPQELSGVFTKNTYQITPNDGSAGVLSTEQMSFPRS